MKKKKSNLPKWKYDFSCKKCRHIQYVKDKAKRRDGDYCIKFIERTDAGLPSPIHADDVRLEVRLYISAKHIEEEQSVGVDSDKNDLCFHRLSAVYIHRTDRRRPSFPDSR